jgi:hypothetical protein
MTEPVFPVLPFDPRSGILPDGLDLPANEGGQVVVVLVGPALRLWAGEALPGLASAWSAAGRGVVLVDGDPDQPLLGGLPGALTSEGVSDVVHFGISPSRALHPVEGRGFDLVPAGTVVADSAQLLESDSWDRLLGALLNEDRLVILALSAAPGVRPSLADRAHLTLRIADGTPEEPQDAPILRPPILHGTRGRKLRPQSGAVSPWRRGLRILGLLLLGLLLVSVGALAAAWHGLVTVPPELAPYWVDFLTWFRSLGLFHR